VRAAPRDVRRRRHRRHHRPPERPADEDLWASLRAAFQVLEEIEITPERRLEVMTLLFENESLRAGHAEKQARWTDLLAPLIEPRLPDADGRAFEARAIAGAAITCLQAASEEWVHLGGGPTCSASTTPPYGLFAAVAETRIGSDVR